MTQVMAATEAKMQVIVVAEPQIHDFFTEAYPDWDTQRPVEGIADMWAGIGDASLSDQSKLIIISDQYYDNTGADSSLELAISTLAPLACVIVIAYDEQASPLIEERVNAAYAASGQEISPFWFIDPQSPLPGVKDALDAYQNPDAYAYEEYAEEEAATEEEDDFEHLNGMVICSTSSKGGAGKSTVGTLIASQIAKSSRKAFEEGLTDRPLKVCIVDMDVRDGQIGFLIGRTTPTALNIRASGDWSAKTIRQFVVHDERLEIDALLAPKRGRTADDLPPHFYLQVIRELRKLYDYIILDTSVMYLDPLIEQVCLPESDAILFVTDLGITSIFGMSRWFEETTAPIDEGGAGISQKKIGVVVNKSAPNVYMDRNRVTSAAKGSPVLAAIPLASTDFLAAANKNHLDLMLLNEDIGPSYFSLARKVAQGVPLSPLIEQTEVGSRVGRNNPGGVQAVPTGRSSAPEEEETAKPKKRKLFGR